MYIVVEATDLILIIAAVEGCWFYEVLQFLACQMRCSLAVVILMFCSNYCECFCYNNTSSLLYTSSFTKLNFIHAQL